MDKATYRKYAQDTAKKSNVLLNVAKAFLVGGLICCLGEALLSLYKYLGVNLETARTLEMISLIFLSVVLGLTCDLK